MGNCRVCKGFAGQEIAPLLRLLPLQPGFQSWKAMLQGGTSVLLLLLWSGSGVVEVGPYVHCPITHPISHPSSPSSASEILPPACGGLPHVDYGRRCLPAKL